ncbi:NAD(P)H-binding protein [Microbacterium sp. zg.Y1090]|uniref:NAD-dependent epimerase/dehydratase family protein n=1 Tax=Microbacterium TaxID=33882 RepID=UPI00214A9380|nr:MULTISPECIES: NAD-dependent epimerase/dehydratase family protein [unclassified Microbacterium]MCR2813341.1 NAD(P)H-binding protein [Microbacterium sp. zg.Y1084]MCR2819825.1 NAD(P)H-binding protein [Microbacterium sp. zg.Y1090]MDL5487936.1 NAD(P)H-binding protein [Microbacterium sp. zg-Y1211]WIM28618.1 NAD(P)H-binding protein [Microbacterium sp. zg-Y1090]
MTGRILVVGATGMIGSRIAADLAAAGAHVTAQSRRPASETDPPAVVGMPRLVADYSSPSLSPRDLEGFDAIVFAAGNDIRHVRAEDEDPEFWDRVQSVGVPRFAALAKEAGVGRFVQIGSYYHHLHPEWAHRLPYVAARRNADDRSRALSDAGFAAITLNPPSIVGVSDARALRRFARLVSWVRGEIEEPELWAPTGGTNYMSVRSLSQAVLGALAAGESGRAYLVGDRNFTYREYFQLLADVAGSTRVVEERDEDHPYQPDRFIVQGRGAVIRYEPDEAEVRLLGYARDDVERELSEIVAAVDRSR